MKIKIPDTLKVGGFTYKIEKDHIFKDRSDINGVTLSDLLLIRLDKTRTVPASVAQVFIHEVLHTIDIAYNADSLDEATVRRLGHGIYQVLVDNEIVEGE